MIYFASLGTSCFDVTRLINICIPTLTKEVVKQSQNKTVNTLKTAARSIASAVKSALSIFDAPAAPAFRVA